MAKPTFPVLCALAALTACDPDLTGDGSPQLDADAPHDTDTHRDGDADTDGQGDADADDDAHPDGDTDADQSDVGDADQDGDPCGQPPGARCNPIVVDAYPFQHWGDTTALFASDDFDRYSCAPDTDESGPEIHFEVHVPTEGLLSARIVEDPDVDVDIHLLESDDPSRCVERANLELDVAVEAGVYWLVVDTFHSGQDLAGGFMLALEHEERSGEPLGTMWNTYYFLANEQDHGGAQDTAIYDGDCQLIAHVREAFHDSVCIEGSGILLDGTVINYAETCTSSCPSARRCGNEAYRVCYLELDIDRYPWGMGVQSRALVPDLSVAVDPSFVDYGTIIYLAELDGQVPPGQSEPHNGCVRADDTGGAIRGNHFDFFSGTRDRWLAWEQIFPTRSNFEAFVNHPRCSGM